MAGLPVGEDDSCGSFRHRKQVPVIVRADWVGNIAQLRLIGSAIGKGVADVQTAITPLAREAAAFSHRRIVHMQIRRARVHEDEQDVGLAFLPGALQPVAIFLRRSTKNGRAYRLRMEGQAYFATWIVLKFLLFHFSMFTTSERKRNALRSCSKIRLSLDIH